MATKEGLQDFLREALKALGGSGSIVGNTLGQA